MVTKDEIRNLEGSISYHGTVKEWVDESVGKYKRLQSSNFTGERPQPLSNLSIAFNIEEALSYAIRNSSMFKGKGVVLISPLVDKVFERFDLKAYYSHDSPMPYLYPNEFSEYVIGKIPLDINQILDKSASDLYGILGDPDLPVPEINVDKLAKKLVDFSRKNIEAIRRETSKLNKKIKFTSPADGLKVVRYLEENGGVCDGFTRLFGNF